MNGFLVFFCVSIFVLGCFVLAICFCRGAGDAEIKWQCDIDGNKFNRK